MLPTLTPEETYRAWETGRLSYRLRNVQRHIRQEWNEAKGKSQKYYIECTRRLGKSSFLLFLLSEYCIKNPQSKAGFYAPVKEGLRDYILPIIQKVFSDCPDDLRPTLDSHLSLTFPNGSSVIFRGSNNQQHRVRRGNDLQIAAIDEARDVDDLDNLIDSVVIPSLFTTSGRLLISSTPADTEDHPLYAIKQQAEREGWMSHYTILDASRLDPDDFPADRIEKWKKETTDQVAWEREYMALWVKDPTKTVIPEWSKEYEVAVERDEFFPYYQKYDGMDFGVRDKTVAVFGYYDFKQAKLIIEDEFVLKDAEVITDNIAKLVKEKEYGLGYQAIHDTKQAGYRNLQIHEKVFRRVADSNELIVIQELDAKHDLNFFATRKDSLAAMINEVRLLVKQGRILVDPKRCPELCGCLTNALWDKNKTELARSKVYGHFDALMALVYLVRNLDTSTNPIPQYYGKSWATNAGVPHNASDPRRGHDALVRAFNRKEVRQEARQDFVNGKVGL